LFKPRICPSCWPILESSVKNLDNPFRTIKRIRSMLKNCVDVNS
jgi:hypothetical protein